MSTFCLTGSPLPNGCLARQSSDAISASLFEKRLAEGYCEVLARELKSG